MAGSPGEAGEELGRLMEGQQKNKKVGEALGGQGRLERAAQAWGSLEGQWKSII